MDTGRRKLILQSIGFTGALISPRLNAANINPNLTVCIPTTPHYAECALNDSIPDRQIYRRHLYDTLFDHHPSDEKKFTRSLVKTYLWDQKNQTLTINLKPNVQFHRAHGFKPTRAMNSADVYYSFNRHTDKSLTLNHSVNAKDRFDETFASIEIIDSLTLRLRSKTKDSQKLFSFLASHHCIVVSAEYADWLNQRNRKIDALSHPIATGEFSLHLLTKNKIVLKRHGNNLRKTNKIDTITYHVVHNAVDRYTLLRMDKCHVSSAIPPPLLSSLQRAQFNKALIHQTPNLLSLVIGSAHPMLRDPIFKEALNSAINRNQIKNINFSGMATVQHSLLMSANSKAHRIPTPTTSTARERLNKYRHSPTSPIAIDLLISSQGTGSSVEQNRVASTLKGQFAALGIKINIQQAGNLQKMSSIKRGQFDLALVLSIPTDRGALARVEELGFLQSEKLVPWESPNIAADVRQYKTSQNADQRLASLERLDEQLNRYAPIIPLLNIPWTDSFHPSVKNIHRDRYGNFDFRDVIVV